MKRKLFFLTGTILLCMFSTRLLAGMMISNLGVPWNEPGTIGDIQAITPDQQFGMAFVTGPGRYRLDSVTFEHIEYAGPLQNFRVQIYRFGPLGTAQPPPAWPLLLHGQFSNPIVDPRPTQWPAWTKFVTYSPNTTITLEANSTYMIAATEPPNGSNETGLLFAPSSDYSSFSGWSGNPYWPQQWELRDTNLGWQPRFGQYSLKLELNATLVPEPSLATLVAAGVLLFARRRFCDKQSF